MALKLDLLVLSLLVKVDFVFLILDSKLRTNCSFCFLSLFSDNVPLLIQQLMYALLIVAFTSYTICQHANIETCCLKQTNHFFIFSL